LDYILSISRIWTTFTVAKRAYKETVNWDDSFTEIKPLTRMTEGENEETVTRHDGLRETVMLDDGFFWKKLKRKPSSGITVF